jgi:hypothetical protein
MLDQGPMNELQERKRLLVLQGDLHRALLQAEAMKLRSQLDWLTDARQKAKSASPWLAVGAGALGLVAASKWRSLATWAPTALMAWRWVQKFRAP